MDDYHKKNLKMLGCSTFFVILFTIIFGLIYWWLGPIHARELQNYEVKISVFNKKGEYVELDKNKYNIKVEPKIRKLPSTEPNDYAAYLVSFVSVLATFIVIANFANASELNKAKEDAEVASAKAESVQKYVETEKKEVMRNFESIKVMMATTTNALRDFNRQKEKITQAQEDIEGINNYLNMVKPIVDRINKEIIKGENSALVNNIKLGQVVGNDISQFSEAYNSNGFISSENTNNLNNEKILDLNINN